MDMNQYLDVFIDEAREHLQALNDHLLALEDDMANISIVQDMFRSAHTLKGMSATMGYEDLASLTHDMENVLDAIRHEQLQVDSDIVDILFQSVDALEAMIQSIIDGGDGKHDVSAIVERLTAAIAGDAQPADEPGSEEPAGQTSSGPEINQYERTVLQQSVESGFNAYHIRVELRAGCILKAARAYMVFELLEKSGDIIKSVPAAEQIEQEQFETSFELVYISNEDEEWIHDLILQVSEVEKAIVAKIPAETWSSATDESEAKKTEKKKKSSSASEKKKPEHPPRAQNTAKKRVGGKTIRVNIERLDTLMNLFSEMVIDRGRLQQIAAELNHPDLADTVEHMNRISGNLQDLILNMRMEPVEQVFNRFPRMVRGLAKDLNKRVDLEMSGAETELDRTVIDEIGDPLVHLLRNAVDHGIEHPEEREKQGKSATGKIRLTAFHSGNDVFIEIVDDGRGIDPDKILNKAIEKGLINAEKAENFSKQDIYQLMFASGFSTSETVSDVSGRGVGLDVVANKIQSLGGSVSIQSDIGKGTKFSIQLPLTLSIIAAMLIQVGREKYAIPLSSIIETAIYKKEDIRFVHGQPMIDFRGKVVPLISLSEIFSIPTEKDDQTFSVVVIRKGDQLAGLVVDSFIGQQEIVLKPLGKYLTHVFGIGGATILGDGQVALIIDCNALVKS